jgi:fatty-acyl-CoA synthase
LVANRIRIVVTDRVPLTEQGKVDRTAIGMILQDDLRSGRVPFQVAPLHTVQEPVEDNEAFRLT